MSRRLLCCRLGELIDRSPNTLGVGPSSNEPHSASTSGETHQLVSLVRVPDESSDQITFQPETPPPADENLNVRRTRRRNVLAVLRGVWKHNKRDRPLGEAPVVRTTIIAIVKYSWLNVLLMFMPLSWISHYVKLNSTLVFVFSFLAIVPLANLLDFATDELSLHFGKVLANLFAFTLDNTVELIVAITGLVKCELAIVQSSLVGSILSNLLLVVGTCFFAGGTCFSEQGFNFSVIQLNSSLLTLSVIAVLLPAAFQLGVQPTDGVDPLTNQQDGHNILSISHGVAVILLFIYLCYIVFQLFSHKNLYDYDHSDVQQSVQYSYKRLHFFRHKMTTAHWDVRSLEAGSEKGQEEKPEMGLWMAIALHVILTALIAITAGFLVDSIDGLTSSSNISTWFVGLILLPILGNAAKHVTAVAVSVNDQIALCLEVAVGSSIQIALFVIPFIVTLGWIMGKPMTLLFDPFESIVLFLSVWTFSYVVRGGKSNWFSGMILICLYAIIAVTFWYYPLSDPAGLLLATCQ